MAVYAFTNGYLLFNSVDLSAYVRSMTLNVEVDDLDKTAMSSTGWRAHHGGLKQGTLEVEFNQDHAAGTVAATIWAALGTAVAVETRPVNTTVSTSNPKFTGNVLVTGDSPIAGAVGDLATLSVSFPFDGAVTRATA